MDEVVSEFLIESHENLNQLDLDLVELEKDPRGADLLASVFRAFHSMKGVAGFLNFAGLEALAHAAESLLSRLRDGELILNAPITSALLATVDAVRGMLAKVEADGSDGDGDHGELIALLDQLTRSQAHGDPPAPAQADDSSASDSSRAEAAVAPAADRGNLRTENSPAPPAAQTAANGSAEHAQAPPGRISLVAVAPVTPHNETSPASPPNPHPDAPAHEESADGGGHAAADATIRVNVHLLDKLMNLVGELVLIRNQILQFSGRSQESTFLGASQRLNLITTELQEGIMKTRMQPIGNIWSKFPRIVRDLALSCGKQVRIEMDGEDTELDKTLIEAIRDPLTHIVRNAIDHGIEAPEVRLAAGKPAEGRLFLHAFHESGQIIIEVLEDGAGIDLEAVRAKALERGLLTPEQAARMSESEIVNLIFQAGFSTKQNVTNISGRGVGMDVVKTNIEKIGGTVDVHSQRGKGTTLRIKIPLTLAIIPALTVTCMGDRYAIPQISLIELVRLEAEDKARRIELVHGAPVYRLRGNLLPLVYLREVLKLSDGDAPSEARPAADGVHIVVLQVAEHQFGLVVDEVNDTEEIVVKPLGKQLKGMSSFAGATIMGDGRVALILDILGVAQLGGVASGFRDRAHALEQKRAALNGSRQQRLLLCKAGEAERVAVPLELVARLEQIPRAEVTHAAGCRVVRYRDRILPLIELGEVLGTGSAGSDGDGPLQVVVFDNGQRRVGVVVDQIVDIVEEAACATQLSNRPGLLGSALVGNKTTDFLDLNAIFEAAQRAWYDAEASADIRHGAILLVDQSAFSRALVRSYLEMAGHDVVEAAGIDDALEKLERTPFELTLVSANLPGNGTVTERLRHRTAELHIALMGLTDERGEVSPEAAGKYDAYHSKLDRQGLLHAVAQLLAGAGSGGGPHQDSRFSSYLEEGNHLQ